jgi:hypothetical protein
MMMIIIINLVDHGWMSGWRREVEEVRASVACSSAMAVTLSGRGKCCDPPFDFLFFLLNGNFRRLVYSPCSGPLSKSESKG